MKKVADMDTHTRKAAAAALHKAANVLLRNVNSRRLGSKPSISAGGGAGVEIIVPGDYHIRKRAGEATIKIKNGEVTSCELKGGSFEVDEGQFRSYGDNAHVRKMGTLDFGAGVELDDRYLSNMTYGISNEVDILHEDASGTIVIEIEGVSTDDFKGVYGRGYSRVSLSKGLWLEENTHGNFGGPIDAVEFGKVKKVRGFDEEAVDELRQMRGMTLDEVSIDAFIEFSLEALAAYKGLDSYDDIGASVLRAGETYRPHVLPSDVSNEDDEDEYSVVDTLLKSGIITPDNL